MNALFLFRIQFLFPKNGPDFHKSGSVMKAPLPKEPINFHPGKPRGLWMEKGLKFLFLFYVTAFIGWLWEVLLFALKDDIFVNRGFLYGPWLPIYGVGAVILLFFLGHYRKKPLLVFVLSAIGGGSLEYAVGWFLNHFYSLRYWNYDSIPFNLQGYTCLYFILAFGVLGTLWVCFLSHKITGAWNQLQEHLRHWILIILSVCFVADCLISIFWPNTGHGITF